MFNKIKIILNHDRNHEHHACVRYRTNKRDRNPKSHWGEEERYPGSTDYTISAGISLIALGFSAVLGIIFGLYPANKAANLKLIEALNL